MISRNRDVADPDRRSPSISCRATLRLAPLRPATMHEAVAVNFSLSCAPPLAGRPGVYGAVLSLKTAPSFPSF